MSRPDALARRCGGHGQPRQPQGKALRRAIRKAGADLHFLSPFSPDLNPGEQVFAKLKTLLCKAAERTVEATWKRIGKLLYNFSAKECTNYRVNSGHAPCLNGPALSWSGFELA
jgi:transposase